MQPQKLAHRRGYALGLLVAVFASAHVDRQIVNILMEPIKRELTLSDGQLGLLTGLSFAVFYATLGIPIAILADRRNRRNIIALSVALWSVMTALCGLAGSYVQLVLARVGVGVGEAGSTPASHSIIGDLYEQRERGRAMGIYSAAICIGTLLGLLIGGWVNQFYGWRVAMMSAGAPGLLLAAIVRFSMNEPARTAVRLNGDTPSVGQTLGLILRVRSLRYIMIAHVITVGIIYGTTTWQASFLARTYHLSTGQIGTLLGLIVGVIGGVGAFCGGWFVDRLVRRDLRWYNWLPIASTLATAVAVIGVLSVTNLKLTIALYVPWAFCQSLYLAPDYAAIQALIPARARALVIAILLMCSNLLGYGLGPLLVGVMSDAFKPWAGEASLRYALGAMLGFAVFSITLYGLASRHIRADQLRLAAQPGAAPGAQPPALLSTN
jgi:MFS family permease